MARKNKKNAANLVAAFKGLAVARRRRRTNASDGCVTLTRTELVTTVDQPGSGQSTNVVDLNPDSFSFLKNLAQSFNRSRWLAMKFVYKPGVSMTTGGLFTMGIDWDRGSTASTSREKVTSLTPNNTSAVWKDNVLLLPPNRLQSRAWYIHSATDKNDKGPGQLVCSVKCDQTQSAKTLGEVWCTYTIQLQGTQSA
jgi:hypothetical protein